MADGDFCDFPPGMDPHIIAQLQNFSQRAGAENFGKRGHCNLMVSSRWPWYVHKI